MDGGKTVFPGRVPAQSSVLAHTGAGAVFCGAGIGSGVYVWPRIHTLSAAQADSPGIIVFTVAGFLLAVAGLVLERACRIPPDQMEKDAAGAQT